VFRRPLHERLRLFGLGLVTWPRNAHVDVAADHPEVIADIKQELEKYTWELSTKLASRSPLTLAAAKATINVGAEMDRDRGIEYALCEFLLLFASKDQKEGMKAFLEKRKPNFKGE